MHTSISKIVILLSSMLLFLACSTPEERRSNAIKSILSNTIEKTDAIEVINESYDSIYSTQRNIKHIKKIQEIILLRDSTLQMLTNFKAKYADENNRVWLKNVSNELKDSYEEILKAEARMVSSINDLATSCNSDTMIGKPQQSIVLKYKANGTIKYGLFIFNENTEISHYKIFSEEEYSLINNFITIAQKDAIEFIPYFENVNIDIVPEDEDPTKSKEERKRIKEEQEARQKADYLAYMKRMNPIPKTFYGATLGKTNVNILLRKLRNEGWEVTQVRNYSYSEYYCSDCRDYIDGLSYNVIRVYAHNGIFDKIEFIDDYTPEWDAKKRYYGSEVKNAFRIAKSCVSEKFGYWSQGYKNEEFDDETIILTVRSDESYWVSYTFSVKEK